MIEVNNVSKSFKNNPAIRTVNFTVQAGEIFGIVGPDGAGKSTLLRLMSSILKPESGSIIIDGENIFKNSFRIKESLAYMPQKFGLYEDLTVEENIHFFGKLYGVSRKERFEREKKLYEFSHLGPFKKRLAGKLSGGMKQKLGLACCLIHSPGVFLLDEPTNGVDPVSRREFWKILYDLLGEGVSIVVSTAYLDEAERCNRLAFMYRGEFIQVGTPQEIKRNLKVKFVEFTTSNPRLTELTLQGNSDYKGIILTGVNLHIFVGNVESAKREITQMLDEKGIQVLSFREALPSLEDCFVDIVAKGGVF